MIAANGVTRPISRGEELPLHPACRADAQTLGPDRRARPGARRRRCPPTRIRWRSMRFSSRQHAADPARFPDLSLAVIKLLGAGEYVAERPGVTAPGHFGLAVKDYTHSTAPEPPLSGPDHAAPVEGGHRWPTRRPYDYAELDVLARHFTAQEDAANKVERQVGKSAAAMLLESRIGEQFDALVTGASDKGTWARLLTVPGRRAGGARVRGPRCRRPDSRATAVGQRRARIHRFRAGRRSDPGARLDRQFPPLAVASLDERLGIGCVGGLHARGVPLHDLARPQRQRAEQNELGEARAVLEVAARGRAALAGLEPVGMMPGDAGNRLRRGACRRSAVPAGAGAASPTSQRR